MTNELTLYAVGDSVMWGQGLSHEDKFATVAYAELTGGSVLDPIHIRARSGAIIGIHRGSDGDPFPADAHRRISRTAEHEVPWSRPTVREQVAELAAAVDDPADVDILLVDGGINDINVETIINPLTEIYDGEFESPPNASEHDPVPADPDYELEDLIRTYCYDDIRTLVSDARDAFPNAIVVVTGYFPIASPLTDFDVTRDWRLILHDASDWAANEFVAQSLYFNRRALYWLRRAVAELDSADSGPGIVFAHPGFEYENSIEAPSSWLWGVDADDSVRETRMDGCEAIGEVGVTATCPIASTGHPNPAGARRYADVVVDGYRRIRRVSLRERLPVPDSGDEISLRAAIERYGFDPRMGIKAWSPHTVIDSVTVTITTGDEGSNADVFLSLAPTREWYLDHEYYNDFEANDTDCYSVDPVLDGHGRLSLWDIDRVELVTESLFDDWSVERVELELNGVPVYEWDGSVTLSGDDSVRLPGFPRRGVV